MPRLVGRDTDVRHLKQLLERRDDSPHIIVIAGATGVGKSALLDAALQATSARVLRAQAVQWEAEWMLGVVAQLSPAVDGGGGAPADVRLRAHVEATSFTVIVVEDAEWCDIASLHELSSLARSRPASSLKVVFVRSDDEAEGAQNSEFFARLSDVTLTVLPLAAHDVATLATSFGLLLRPLVAERLSTFTGGMPQLVLDLAREVPAEVWSAASPELPAPRQVRLLVAGELDRADRQTRELVEAVAIMGTECSLADAIALSEVSEPLATYEHAARAGLLRMGQIDGARRLLTMKPIVRRAVLENMGDVARAAAHLRAADLHADPVRRLRHQAAARVAPDSELAAELDRAASDSASLGNWADSAELLMLAGGLTADSALREERILRTIDALVGSGDALAAEALVSDVDSMAETPLHNAVLGYLAIVQGRCSEASGRLARAWQLTDVYQDSRVKAVIGQRYVLHSLAQCRAGDLVAWADRTVELAPADAPESLEARAIRGLGQSTLGDTEAALAGYRQMSEAGLRGAQAQRIVMARGWISLAIDEVDQARSELEAALPTNFLGGSLRISLWSHAWLARVHFLSGRWNEAVDVAQRGLDLAARSGMALMVPLLSWTISQVFALRGQSEAAAESLLRGDARALDYSIMRVPAALAWAAEAETRADYRAVIRALAPFAAATLGDMVDDPGYWPWADIYANALVIEGHLDEAEAFLAPREAAAREHAHRSAIARLAYPRGRLLGARGDIDGAREVFDEALDILAELPLEFDRARVNFAYGQTLRRAGRRRDAEVAISAARQTFSALGASTYVERCDRESHDGGSKPGSGQLASSLTLQERRVAVEIALGRSNREIATDLFISEKTVQYHLTRIYAKSGVRTRGQLASLWTHEVEQGEAAAGRSE